MKPIFSSQFTKEVWTFKLGLTFGADIIVLGGFYLGHHTPRARFDRDDLDKKYWYIYLYPPCSRKNGVEIAKIGFTTDKGEK